MIQISIIIATWNAASTLTQCIDSIVPQLTEECELLIIDGGSNDATNDIIASFADKVTYTISEKDNGIYDAWNKGIKVANGKWIGFIGADDILLPGAIAAYLDVIRSTRDIDSYDYICAHNEYVDKTGKLLKVLGGTPVWSQFRKRMTAAHVASLHNKKNLFESIGDYDYEHYHICADYELLIRKKSSLKYLFIENHIAKMEVGGMSFSTKAIKETYRLRKQHQSVNAFYNILLFMRDWIAFKLFIIRKSVCGNKL